MAIPNYTHLKLKMPSPHEVIIVDSSFQRAYQCEVESCELASEELAAIRENTTEEAPDSNWIARSFEPAEGVKEVLIDPQNSVDKKV
jgi:hypothetical protein